MKERCIHSTKKRKINSPLPAKSQCFELLTEETNSPRTSQTIQHLCQALEDNFPLEETSFIDLFPFPNEANYYEILEQLASIPPKSASMQKAVLLFGNSNLLSMLPEIADRAKLLILADIDFRIHAHNLHLLNCLFDATSPLDFFQRYHINNPLIGIPCQGKKRGVQNDCPEVFHGAWLESTLRDTTAYLNEFGFLSSEARFKQCQVAARKLSIVTIQLDLTNKLSCYQLANVLHTHPMNFLLCNFSNIHQYDDKQNLCDSVSLLLHHSEDFLIMYSKPMEAGKSDLTTQLTLGLSDYFKDCLPISYQDFRRRLAHASDSTSSLPSRNPNCVFHLPRKNKSSILETNPTSGSSLRETSPPSGLSLMALS